MKSKMVEAKEEPYEVLSQTQLPGGYALQERLDLDRGNLPDHLNQDITNVSGRVSRDILGDNHFRPLR
jgi:hypothetical protein